MYTSYDLCKVGSPPLGLDSRVREPASFLAPPCTFISWTLRRESFMPAQPLIEEATANPLAEEWRMSMVRYRVLMTMRSHVVDGWCPKIHKRVLIVVLACVEGNITTPYSRNASTTLTEYVDYRWWSVLHFPSYLLMSHRRRRTKVTPYDNSRYRSTTFISQMVVYIYDGLSVMSISTVSDGWCYITLVLN